MTEWSVEHNEQGWRADAYLYCVEVIDPETEWRVPLAPSWVIAEKNNVVAKLVPNPESKRYEIEIHEGVSKDDLKAAKACGTIANSRVVHPMGGNEVPIDVIRQHMRMWEKCDFVPRPDDVFQERLFCIRWVETYFDENGLEQTRRHYRALTHSDLERENQVVNLLKERFIKWQELGYLPSQRIEPGEETSRLRRERGWTHWHHLFTPRQLLMNGLISKETISRQPEWLGNSLHFTTLMTLTNVNSRLCRWRSGMSKSGGIGAVEDTFSNQALNTIYNPPSRTVLTTADVLQNRLPRVKLHGKGTIRPTDIREVEHEADMWITDPPYGDAINYHELADFFLSWLTRQISDFFPDWYSDSRRTLAISGADKQFLEGMIDGYRNLCDQMPDNGIQIVMFTHQDASVWADLSMIMWAAGLRVTAAWTIATETDSALKQGNYVQGTVLLVLRKRTETESVFLDEVTHEVEAEVRRQLDSMTEIEDDSDPNFGDADYQLAAYAAALRVLTAQPIYEIDPAKEILRE